MASLISNKNLPVHLPREIDNTANLIDHKSQLSSDSLFNHITVITAKEIMDWSQPVPLNYNQTFIEQWNMQFQDGLVSNGVKLIEHFNSEHIFNIINIKCNQWMILR